MSVLVAWLVWQRRDSLGTCELPTGYPIWAGHYHALGPVKWWVQHVKR